MRIYVIISVAFSLFFSTSSFGQNFPFWKKAVRRHGLKLNQQAYCFRHSNGEIIGKNIDKPMFPASVSKLYLSYFALKKLGPDHRFKTKVLIKNGHIHFRGGNDPYFSSESLYFILSKLNKLGITKVKHLTFDSNFYFNWALPEKNLAGILKKYVNTQGWNLLHSTQYQNLLFQINDLKLKVQMPHTINFSAKHVYKSHNIDLYSFQEEIVFESSPLKKHLKEMNIYSNNFIANQLFEYLGGELGFSRFMKKEFKVDQNTITFDNGAGFEPNVTTCRLTIYLLEELREYLSRKGLVFADIVSVPGEDKGTLEQRFQNDYKRTVIAKTGSLRHTATLAGMLNTESRPYAFSIFNRTYALQQARNLQDKVVKDIFEVLGPPEQVKYKREDFISLIESRLQVNIY
ncbi:MAG: hypothetical protein HN576_14915 [Bacteriovoracaceae bacterium]|jgi:serine-type D-Ala-D-Ala carboxypeptidase/endopeptidase (penicillin-binding protein 4)|nr:hypothetical protein [Bacteriovoracaceae bacterium]